MWFAYQEVLKRKFMIKRAHKMEHGMMIKHPLSFPVLSVESSNAPFTPFSCSSGGSGDNVLVANTTM